MDSNQGSMISWVQKKNATPSKIEMGRAGNAFPYTDSSTSVPSSPNKMTIIQIEKDVNPDNAALETNTE